MSLRAVSLTVLVGGVFATASFLACAAPVDDSASSGGNAALAEGVKKTWPTPGTTDNALDKAKVLAAMKKVKHDFYDTADGYDRAATPAATTLPPPIADVKQCVEACPEYYSDIVCHYYCQYPAYADTVPNIRGCVTFTATGTAPRVELTPVRSQYYPEIYDYCLYQNMDIGRGVTPPYDQATIEKNRAAGTKPGMLAWVDKNQPDMFKSLMFTWYDPFTYNEDDQEEIVNAFYDVKLTKKDYTAVDAADVAECKAKRPAGTFDATDGTHCSTAHVRVTPFKQHPNYEAILAFMKAL